MKWTGSDSRGKGVARVMSLRAKRGRGQHLSRKPGMGEESGSLSSLRQDHHKLDLLDRDVRHPCQERYADDVLPALFRSFDAVSERCIPPNSEGVVPSSSDGIPGPQLEERALVGGGLLDASLDGRGRGGRRRGRGRSEVGG